MGVETVDGNILLSCYFALQIGKSERERERKQQKLEQLIFLRRVEQKCESGKELIRLHRRWTKFGEKKRTVVQYETGVQRNKHLIPAQNAKNVEKKPAFFFTCHLQFDVNVKNAGEEEKNVKLLHG